MKLKWDLRCLPKKSEFEQELKEAEKEIETIEKWTDELTPKMTEEKFKEMILYFEGLDEKLARIGYLPALLESLNSKDPWALMAKGKVNDLALKISSKTRIISHWMKGLKTKKKRLDEKNAQRLFGVVKDLEYGLKYGRLMAKYTLSQEMEEVIENKDVNGVGVVTDLREMIENDFEYQLGKKNIRTQAELLKFVYSPKKKVRKEAYRQLLTKHKQNMEKMMAIYQAVVKDWAYETKLRGYKNPMAMRNVANQVPDEAVETLLGVIKDNRKIFQNYFMEKAERLGVKRLSRFDLYAPWPRTREKKIEFEKAKELVLETFREFSPEFARKAQKVIDEGHVDSHPQKDKRSGAFCATVSPKITPYVLTNYTGTFRDVYTLAHELGHAVHSLYADKHYPSSQQATLPLAETASTMAELIVFEKLVEKEKNQEIRRQMIDEKMAESYATILRQNYFVLFEIEAHKKIPEGIMAEELGKIYLDNLKEQFGKSIKVDPLFAYEWAYVSHFFESPFYCYAYSFGELLAMSLLAKYKKEGKEAVVKIEKILTAGGSEDPEKILKEVGVEMRDRDFWQGAFGILNDWQKRLQPHKVTSQKKQDPGE